MRAGSLRSRRCAQFGESTEDFRGDRSPGWSGGGRGEKVNGSPGPFRRCRPTLNGPGDPFYVGNAAKMAADRGSSHIRLKQNPLWSVRASWKSSCGFSRRVSEPLAKLVRDRSPRLEWRWRGEKVNGSPSPFRRCRPTMNGPGDPFYMGNAAKMAVDRGTRTFG